MNTTRRQPTQRPQPRSGHRPVSGPASGAGAVQVTRTAPTGRRRAGRIAIVTVGLALCLVGFLSSVFSLMIVMVFVAFAAGTDNPSGPDVDTVVLTVSTAAGSAIAWSIGLKLLQGRRRTVLFLRKFGFDDAKSFVTHAAGRALGRRWRLVTLDDLDTPAIGSSRWSRLTTVIVTLLALAALGFLLFSIADVLSSDTEIVGDAASQAADNADNPVEGFVAAIAVAIVTAIVAALALVFVVALLSVFAAAAAIFGITSFGAARSLHRAERDERGRARSRDELVAFLNRVERDKRRMFAPRITVVRVIDALWREAVTGVADISDAVLVDISDPSESLLWEIETLHRRPDIRLVPIGSAPRVEAMVAAGGHDRDDAMVLRALAGYQVLVYDDDPRRFARELHQMLETGTKPTN